MRKLILTVALAVVASPAFADPLGDVLAFCRDDTGAPRLEHAAIVMPDGKLRGTRPPATLTAEARKAKSEGKCSTAIEWLLHAVEHDEGAKNVLRANPDETCKRL